MSFKNQLYKIKENWLLVLVIAVAFLALNSGSPLQGLAQSSGGYFASKMAVAESASYDRGYGIIPPMPQGDFAPEVSERKITKTASMTNEVKQGAFKDAEAKLKSIVSSSSSYLLNENVNKYETGWKTYYNGYYTIKVDTKKYKDVVLQLKGIGEVKSFNENAEDITGSYTNSKIELDAEKQRLERFRKMYDEATLVADKIQLNDKIFDLERRIKYLEDSMKNMDKQVDYSTVYISINEKQSEYAGIVLVKFSELVRNLVSSINSLFSLVFIALPYAVAAGLIWAVARWIKRR